MTTVARVLTADCGNCAGLCCVALPFAASADFAHDKPAGRPCLHLTDESRCDIHATLRPAGYRGCTVFDCYGAGQRITQETFAGRTWRTDPGAAQEMFDAFAVMRQLHEMLVHLTEAARRTSEPGLRADVLAVQGEIETLAAGDAPAVLAVDPAALRPRVGDVLSRVSEQVRAGLRPSSHRGADLTGAQLRGTDLRGADLRGALLIAADLRGADLRCADLLGADLRDADVSGADLTDVLYLTGPQAAAARGDAGVRLPGHVARPAQWSPGIRR
ncbi:MAG: hypothetical protein QOK14_1650 [Frankiaceae bacterium]|nr:hypothetical protein [Frankiaceae bacterium]